jgi:predicted O-methyltransferase YrrM
MLQRYGLDHSKSGPKQRSMRGIDPESRDSLLALWDKYSRELAALSVPMAAKLTEMQAAGYGVGFGDLEGELLYILVREQKPEIIYEISPNCGYSTNYLLAAVTRNGTGRVESFEMNEAFNGVPIRDVIRGNLIGLCDPARHHVTIGDARVESLRRLAEGIPSFTLIDSCHDDYFAEFYVKALLPRLTGTVVIQDILHFDPRPEGSTESFYLLSYLYETGNSFLPFALYEDTLMASPARAGIARRRPLRSNTIALSLGDRPACSGTESADRLIALLERLRRIPATSVDPHFPLNSASEHHALLAGFRDRTAPENRYVAAVYGGALDEATPGLGEVVAMALTGRPMTPAMAEGLVRVFDEFDAGFQLLVLQALTAKGYPDRARALMSHVSGVSGAVLPQCLALAAAGLGLMNETAAWIAACRRGAADRTIDTAHRALMQCAVLAAAFKAPDLANNLFDEILAIRDDWGGMFGGNPDIEREIAEFCQSHPRFAARLHPAPPTTSA